MPTATVTATPAALWKAAKKHDVEAVKQLILQSNTATGTLAIVNEYHPRKSTTPLMIACAQRDKRRRTPQRSGSATIRLLLEFGAAVDYKARDKDGNTALHYAAMANQARGIEYMLHAGVDAFALNSHGHAAIDLARWYGNKEVVDVLTQNARIHSGWLFVKKVTDPNASLQLRVWKKRYAVALACDNARRQIELSLYKDATDVKPKRVILLRVDTHRTVQVDREKWLDKHNMFHVVTLLVVQKTSTKRRFSRTDQNQQLIVSMGETERMKFATESSDMRDRWIAVLNGDHVENLPRIENEYESPIPFAIRQPSVTRPSTVAEVAQRPQQQQSPALRGLSVGVAVRPPPPPPVPPRVVYQVSSPLSSEEEFNNNPPLWSAADISAMPQASAPSFSSTDSIAGFVSNIRRESFGDMRRDSLEDVGVAVDDGPSRGECVICMDAKRDAICVPCGHVAGCYSCLSRHAETLKACPICRAHTQTVIKIYEC